MAGEASILHADLDAFYASVEQRDNPRLRGRPVIVGAGVVLAASYEAKACGVRTAMGGRQALRLCPHAIVVEPRFPAYAAASRAVFAVFEQTTPLVQGISIDEAFLEVAGLARIAGPAAQIAAKLRADVRDRVGLPITVGVARTKFLAKVASRVAKPDGLLVVAPPEELDFLHRLPVELVWGVGPVTAQKLRQHGIRTVAGIASVGRAALICMLGQAAGQHLHALAHNHDPRPVQVGVRRSSMGAQQALGQRRRSAAELDLVLAGLVERVTRRMRAAGRSGRTVTLRLRFADYTRVTRSHTLHRATADTAGVLDAARALLAAALPTLEQRGASLLGVAVANLDDSGAVQLSLPFDRDASRDVDAVVDAVRRRFGPTAIGRATLIGLDPDPIMPMLPD